MISRKPKGKAPLPASGAPRVELRTHRHDSSGRIHPGANGNLPGRRVRTAASCSAAQKVRMGMRFASGFARVTAFITTGWMLALSACAVTDNTLFGEELAVSEPHDASAGGSGHAGGS